MSFFDFFIFKMKAKLTVEPINNNLQLSKKRNAMPEHRLEKHFNGNDRFADLAKDMNSDYRFPKIDDYDEIYEYLVYVCGACPACVDVFKESWAEYEGA